MKKILVIVAGPTASGKTQLAIELAKYFQTEIVSADSRQFYKELPIGTAQPSTEELNNIKHHFVGSHSVSENLNAGEYAEQATELINTLFLKHQVVILTGGSGLYIDAVINGFDDFPKSLPEIRQQLNSLYKNGGLSALQELLSEKDPESLNSIDIQNSRRLIRALEICLSTGKKFSELIGESRSRPDWEIIFTGIDWPRQELYSRINERVRSMLKNGLENEVRSVMNYRTNNALHTVGYKEMFDYLDGKINLEQAEEMIAKNTRNYAKRQITWFRRYENMMWIAPGKTDELISYISKKTENNH